MSRASITSREETRQGWTWMRSWARTNRSRRESPSGAMSAMKSTAAAAPAICMLAGAIRRGLADMESQADTQRRLVAETADYIEQTREFIAIPRQLLMLWDGGAGAGELPEGAAQIAAGVSQRVDSVGKELDRLDSIARRCRGSRRRRGFGADGEASTTQSLLGNCPGAYSRAREL